MKVNLLFGDTESILLDHLNLDPTATIDDKFHRTPCPLDELHRFVCPAEADAIRAIHALDMCGDRRVLAHWVTFLRKGGILTLGGLDFGLLMTYTASGRVSEVQALEQIYSRRSASSWNTTCKTLCDLGLEIIRNTSSGLYYCVTARRPE